MGILTWFYILIRLLLLVVFGSTITSLVLEIPRLDTRTKLPILLLLYVYLFDLEFTKVDDIVDIR
jgi:hypothetical protein